MAIAINGSGTITGISVGGIPDGTVDTDVLAANAVTYAKIGTTEQGQLCKAWCNFNGTGVVAIRASYNVSSITDNGTGDYTVNFTTALADTNFVVTAIGNGFAATEDTGAVRTGTRTTSSIQIRTTNGSATAFVDVTAAQVAIFR